MMDIEKSYRALSLALQEPSWTERKLAQLAIGSAYCYDVSSYGRYHEKCRSCEEREFRVRAEAR